MNKRTLVIVSLVVLLLAAAVPAFAAGPNFGPAIFADGKAWGTKGNGALPAPNEHNRQSFDGLYKFTNSTTEGQLPVAEAAPGNPNYNGGRWIEYLVTWNAPSTLVTSYAELHALEMAGDVSIAETGNYFQCPLLPVKN